MSRIDIDNILKKTNQLIGYENYEREEKIMKRKLRNMTFALVAVMVLAGGTFTVNAMTDNSIVDGIKSLFSVKVNGEEKNAKCEKTSNGTLKCTLDKEVLGKDDTEMTVEFDEEKMDGVSVSVDGDGESETATIDIKAKE